MVFRAMRTIWQFRLQVVVAACMFSTLIIGGGHVLGQIREASERFDRDERRLERKLEGVQNDFEELRKKHDDLRLDIEKRLAKIETYQGIELSVLGLLLAGVLTQWGMRLFDLLGKRTPKGAG